MRLKPLVLLTLIYCLLLPLNDLNAQSQSDPTTQSKKIKLFVSTQMWLRHTDLNPGSTIQGSPKKQVTEVSVRRFRAGLAGYIVKNVFVKFQLGINNLNYLSSSSEIRILDLEAFYTFSKYLTIGGGKTGYIGLSRYASPASAAALGFDLPFFAMTTVGLTNDILRRPSVAAKGDIGKLHYRGVVARPQKVTTAYTLSTDASFQQTYQEPQYSMYFKYQFFDKEKSTSAFMPGSYYGTKKILNLGAGFQYQKNALHGLNDTDTLAYDMVHFAVDLFLDIPLNTKNTRSLTSYSGYFNYDFGKNYIRKVGVNNAADGIIDGTYNGTGNSFPASGTGQIYYTQVGLRQITNNKGHAIVPFASVQVGNFDKLNDLMIMYDFGLSYLFDGHKNKFTFGIQSRPIFDTNIEDYILAVDRKNMYVLQYQIKI